MIVGVHSIIRTAEPDDAPVLKQFYEPRVPRSYMLDARREMLLPSTDEVREVLARPELRQEGFYAVEDKGGEIRGFCSLRSGVRGTMFAEMIFMIVDDALYQSPLAREALAFLRRLAFQERGLAKIVANCLDVEAAYRALLIEQGFVSNGVQRDMLYSKGTWHDMETLSLMRRVPVGEHGHAGQI